MHTTQNSRLSILRRPPTPPQKAGSSGLQRPTGKVRANPLFSQLQLQHQRKKVCCWLLFIALAHCCVAGLVVANNNRRHRVREKYILSFSLSKRNNHYFYYYHQYIIITITSFNRIHHQKVLLMNIFSILDLVSAPSKEF